MMHKLNLFLSAGQNRKPEGWLKVAVTIWSVCVALWEIYFIFLGTLDPFIHSMIFMSLMLPIVFITKSPFKSGDHRISVTDLILSAVLIAFAAYVWFHQERFITRFPLVDPLSGWDIFFGITIIAIVLEATRRSLGSALTTLAIVTIIYVFAGHFIEGQFYHRYLDVKTYIDHIVYTINGLGGMPMRVASTLIFVFITLGVFLEKSGGGDFFNKLANSIAGGRVGGPAKVAVVASAAFGTISGSPVADVATTGSFTIPLMKRLGYKPVFAGAVEAAASTGGAILPPVMGTAAFLMVEFTGTSYREIAIASILPALLYYFGCYVQVHLHSQKSGLTGMPREQIPKFRDAFKYHGEFIVAFATLIYLIFAGYTPPLAGIITIIVTVLLSWIRRNSRMGLEAIISCFTAAAIRMAPLVAACAAAGLVVGGLNVTGLASKFISMITALAHQNAFLALLISAGVLILLGMGMQLAVVYILGASLIAPGLMEMGIPQFQAHLFIVFYSALSAITPPVAVAAYTAAGIADADPMAIGWQATKLTVAGFLVPFVFVTQPFLLLQGTWDQILLALLSTTLGVFYLSISAEGFFKGNLTIFHRLGFLLSGILLVMPGLKTDLVGLFIGTGLLISRFHKKGDEYVGE